VFATTSVIAVNVAALSSTTPQSLVNALSSAAVGDADTSDGTTTVEIILNLVTSVEVSIPEGITVADMTAALQAEMCGSITPPTCEVTALTSGRRQLSTSVSFETKQQLNPASSASLAAPTVVSTNVASALGVEASAVSATVGTSSVQAEVTVTQEGSAASAEASATVSTLSDTSTMANALGVSASAIEVKVAPKIIAPPKPPPTPPPPMPPLPPSPPPPRPSPVTVLADSDVTATFTLSGSVADYTSSVQDKIRTVIADGAQVDVSAVSLSLRAASVLVAATITPTGSATAATIRSVLAGGIMKDAAALQSALASAGITAQVESPPVLSSSGTSASPAGTPSPSPSSDGGGGGGAGVGLAAAAAGGGLVLLLVVIIIWRRLKRSRKRARTVDQFTQGESSTSRRDAAVAMPRRATEAVYSHHSAAGGSTLLLGRAPECSAQAASGASASPLEVVAELQPARQAPADAPPLTLDSLGRDSGAVLPLEGVQSFVEDLSDRIKGLFSGDRGASDSE